MPGCRDGKTDSFSRAFGGDVSSSFCKGHRGCAHLTGTVGPVCKSHLFLWKKENIIFWLYHVALGDFPLALIVRGGLFLKLIFSHDGLNCLPLFWEMDRLSTMSVGSRFWDRYCPHLCHTWLGTSTRTKGNVAWPLDIKTQTVGILISQFLFWNLLGNLWGHLYIKNLFLNKKILSFHSHFKHKIGIDLYSSGDRQGQETKVWQW